jgi:hypothetical protein
MEETASELILKTAEAEPMEIPLSRISKRQNLPLACRPCGHCLSKREIRDVIEFLANQK